MTYVDGFVASVPKERKQEFIEHAEAVAKVFLDHGCLRHVEAWEDDVPDGELTSMPLAVKREAGEAIIFSWLEWPSKEVRDQAMKSAMDDPRMKDEKIANMPFDGKRMIMGGFSPVLDRSR
ncbi:DUF1428 domain-containing protein [Parvularcula sp. ZS-1/3]|uniref:DUF1428 domain-containing protein n=1 Tax=Parvularcula mediterranea TaxID=2732508 RepID=A0A7Y3RLQ7_9PROT|nr:DUF1428 domain-containing protein [Parvularcula mediterranea]NNU15642.1 DUF1428 domain-containing protein [Parvularcula mediterranea]